MVHDTAAVVTLENYSVIFNDLGWYLTQISRARHYSTFNLFNIANTVLYVITKD